MATITVSIQQGNNTLNSHRLATENTEALRIQAQKNVNYLLTDESTGFAPENLTATRHGKDLHIAFEGSQEADLIIENYYEDGNNNLLIGLHENGQYYAYIPESANSLDIVTQLAEQVSAGQALGGEALNAAVFNSAFNPAWLFLPLAIGGIAAAAGGGSSNNNDNSTTPQPNIQGSSNAESKKFDGGASVIPSANAGTLNISYPDHNGKTVSIKATKGDHDNDPSTPAIWTATDQNGKTLPNAQDPKNPNSPWIDPTSGKVTLPPNSVPNGETVSAEQSIDGKNSSPATEQITDQIPPNAPSTSINQDNGEVIIKPNTDPSTTKTTTTYINDQGEKTTVHTAKVDHDNDPSTPDTWTVTVVDEKGKEIPNSGVEINPNTGIITIAGEKIKEGSKIEAKASDDGSNISPPATDYKPAEPKPRIIANIDGSATVSALKNVKDSTLEISGTYAQPQAGMNKFRFTLNWDGIKWAAQNTSDPITVGTGKDGKPIVTVNAGVAKDGSKITAIQKVPGLGQGKHEVTMRDQIPEPQVIDNSDGSVSITPTPSKIAEPTEVTISYTDENGAEKTVTVSKDPNNNNEWTSSNPNIAADPKTGAVTLPESSIQDGSTVSAKQKVTLTDPNTQQQADAVSSDETVIAGNAIPNPEIIANNDGSVSIKPSDTATQTTVNYTDENGEKQEKTFTKEDTNGDGRPDTWKDNDPNDKVSIDPMTGKITIPADQVKDDSTATATQTLPNDTQGTGQTTAKAQNGDSSTTVKPDIKAGPDGSAIVTLHPDAEKSTITYTDEKGKGKIVTVSKDPKTNEWTSGDPAAVSIDASGEKPVITVAGTDIKDGSTVTATQSTAAGASAPASVKVADNTPEPTIKAEENGSVSVTPSKKATEVNIRYTDESGAEKTVTVSKDLNTNEWKSSDPAVSVDKDTGTVSIPADKVKDGSEVTANQTVDGQKSNDATDRAKENDTADKPSIAEEPRNTDNDAPISVTPGEDNTKVTIDYTDEDGKEQTIVVEKDKDGNWKPSKDSTVEVKDTPTADNKTPYVDQTGKVTLPKDAVDNDKPVTVTGEKDGSAPAKEQTDPTDKPIIAEEPRDKDNDAPISVTPGDDNTKATIDYTDEEDKPQTIVGTKTDTNNDGKPDTWTATDKDGNTLPTQPDANNPKQPWINPTTGEVTLPKDAVDNDKPVTVTGEKDGSAPAKVQTDPTDKPIIAEEKRDADNDAPISVTPGDDNTKATIDYTDEEDKPQTIVGTKTDTNNDGKPDTWTATDKDGNTLPTQPDANNPKQPWINPTTGEVTLPKDAVDNDKPVTVTGEKDGSAPAKVQTDPTDKPIIAEEKRDADNDAPISVTPGDDNTKATIDYTDEEDKPQTIVGTKTDTNNDGKPDTWTATDKDGNTLPTQPDANNPKQPWINPTTGEVTLPKDAVDNDKPVTVTGEKAGSAPAKVQTDPTDKPDIAAKDDGSVEVTPKGNNTKVLVGYKDEDSKDQTIVVEKDKDGNWKPSKDSTVEVKDTPTADNKTPYVDSTGKVTLPKDAVKDGSTVKATGENDKGNPAINQANSKKDSAGTDVDPDNTDITNPTGGNIAEGDLVRAKIGLTNNNGGEIDFNITFSKENSDPNVAVANHDDFDYDNIKFKDDSGKDIPGINYDRNTGKITVPAGVDKFNVELPVKAGDGVEVDQKATVVIGKDKGVKTKTAEITIIDASKAAGQGNGITITAISEDTGNPKDFVTNDTALTVSGTLNKALPADEKIQVTLNEKTVDAVTVDAVVDASGTSWTADFTGKALPQGKHLAKAQIVSTDKTKTAGPSDDQTIVIDTAPPTADAPTVAIQDGGNGDDIINAKEKTDGNDKVNVEVTIPANAEVGDVIVVKDKAGNELGKFTVGTDANAGETKTVQADIPADGENALEVTATVYDKAGNKGKEGTDTASVDTAAPTADAPTVAIQDGDDGIINAKEKTDGNDKVNVEVTIPANAKVGDVIVVTDKEKKELGKFTVGTDANAGETKTVQADIPADGENALEVTATVYDKAGNKGKEGTDTASVDTAAPTADAPTVAIQDGDDGIINAKEKTDGNDKVNVEVTIPANAEVGDVIVVKDKAGNELGKFTVGTDANAGETKTVQADIPADGENALEVTATVYDKAGNKGEEGKDTASVDTAAPTADAPTVAIQDGDDGIINAKEKTDGNDKVNVEVTIPANAEVGDVIVVKDKAGNELGKFTVGTDANAGETKTVQADIPADGENALEVTATVYDKAGNKGEEGKDTASVDTAPPTADAPTVAIQDGDDGIINAKEKADGKDKVDVEVTIPANAKVGDVIVVTDKEKKELGKFTVGTDANAGETKTVQADIPADGENALEVTATVYDKAGNKGEEGKDTASVDTAPPTADAPTVAIQDGDDGIINAKEKTDGNDKVNVEVTIPANAEVGDVIVVKDKAGNELGKFTVGTDANAGETKTVQADIPADGENALEVTATVYDKAGNKGEEGTDTASVDTAAPTADAPTVAIQDGDDGIINAKEKTDGNDKVNVEVTIPANAEVGDVIVVKDKAGNELGKFTVGTDANAGETKTVQADIPADGENALEVTATVYDKAGNKGEEGKDTASVDTAAPTADAPTVAIQDGDDGIINAKEKTDGNDKVNVEVTIPANAEVGDVIVVKDKAGNELGKFTVGTDANAGETKTVQADIPADGENALEVTATVYDKAGNKGEEGKDTASVDTAPPTADAPTVAIQDGDDGIINAKEKADGKDKVDVEVTIPANAKVGDVIVVTDKEKKELGKFTVGTDANAGETKTVQADIPADGENALEVTATVYDKAGNKGEEGKDTASVDTAPPTADAPTVAIQDGDDGIINAKEKTDGNDKVNVEVTIPANAEVGDVIVVKDKAGNELGKFTVGTDANAGETKTVQADIPADGENALEVTATVYDKAGNKGEEGTDTASVDTAAPTADAPTVAIQDGDDGIINAKEKTDGNDKVNVEVTIPANAKVGDVIVVKDKAGNELGKFTVGTDANAGETKTVQADIPADGENALEVTATVYDKAGNKGEEGKDTASVDTAVPQYAKAEVPIEGNSIVLTYDEDLDESNPPSVSNFTVTVDGKRVIPTDVSVSGDKVTLTLPEKVGKDKPVTVEYNDPSANNDPNAIQDEAGNDAADLPKTSVTNNSTFEPFTPKKLTLKLDKDTGSSESDNVTNNPKVNVDNIQGKEWQYSLDGGKSWENGRGTSFNLINEKNIATGKKQIVLARLKDYPTQTTSDRLEATYDNIKPTIHQVNMNTAGKNYAFTGKTEPGAKVEVNNGSQSFSGTANDKGIFTIDLKTNNIGQGRKFTVKATDIAGNEDESAATYTVDQVSNIYGERAQGMASWSKRAKASEIDRIGNNDNNIVLVGAGGGLGDISTAIYGNAIFDMGDGNDALVATTIQQTVGSKTDVAMGAGNDSIVLSAYIAKTGYGGLNIDMGAGNDVLDVGRHIEATYSAGSNKLAINMGSGDDTLIIGTYIANKGIIDIDGGTDYDTLIFKANSSLSGGQNMSQVRNFEKVQMTKSGFELNLTIKDVMQNTDHNTNSYLTIDGVSGTTVDLGGNGGTSRRPDYGDFEKANFNHAALKGQASAKAGYTAYWDGSNEDSLVYIQNSITII